jgi:putative peptide zinc metalloprotease protein
MQTLFSEHWHAVRGMQPRLRPGVQPLHRMLRGKPWVLLQDPVTQRFHRVAPAVWRVLELLDGRRTLDELWTTACMHAEAGGAGQAEAISQHELVQLMGTLYANDLLQTQVSPDAAEVFQRYTKQRRARFKQSWLNPMSIKLPLLHPDAWFEGRAGLARALFSLPVLLLWLLFVAPAAVLAWQHWQALTENLSDRVLSTGNLALLWLTYPLVKAVHEWAHGMAVKAWGGVVREIGIMFIVFTPVPYVDATSSYGFPSKWARAAVAAAGIMAELLIGAIAVYVWLLAEPGWVTAVAFNVFLITGVSTLLVNGNPLMRYDGYFILCDVLEVPNLAQRATAAWVWVLDRYAYGARDAAPPLEVRGEWPLLLAYGAVSPVYRLLITVGLIWFVAGTYLLLGVVMALAAAWTALVMPLWKGWKHLREGASLARRREAAFWRTVLALGGAALVIGAVPLPFHSVHQGVVWLPDEAIVRSEVAGRVLRPLVAAGQSVAAGQPLALVDSPQIDAELAVAEAELARTQAQLRLAETESRVQAEALRAALLSRQTKLAEARRRADALVVKAGTAGVWTPAPPTELAGRWLRRGEVLGHVLSTPSRLVRTAVNQDDMDLVKSRGQGVQVRLAQAPRSTLAGSVLRPVAGAEQTLVAQALGTAGGGEVAVDPAKPGGTHSLQRVVDLEVQLAQPVASALFGDRAYVRFDLGKAPLGWQWFLRLRQLFLARLSV